MSDTVSVTRDFLLAVAAVRDQLEKAANLQPGDIIVTPAGKCILMLLEADEASTPERPSRGRGDEAG